MIIRDVLSVPVFLTLLFSTYIIMWVYIEKEIKKERLK